MEIQVLQLEEYLSLGLRPSTVFGSGDFLRLNSHKAKKIMAFTDSEHRMGIVFGKVDGEYRSPWSAPYTSVDTSDNVSEYELRLFGEKIRSLFEKDAKIRLVIPPGVYNGPEKFFFDGFRKDNDLIIKDTSFHIPLAVSEGELGWNKSARRNLKKGILSGLTLSKLTEASECYNLICNHHQSLGYNMAMTKELVEATAKIIPIDFWIVRQETEALAAMYCYRVRNDIVQVISSGDTPQGRKNGAAIFMERGIIDYYRHKLVHDEKINNPFIDHGPTSVLGIQNEGLAAFKKSFGCEIGDKITLITS